MSDEVEVSRVGEALNQTLEAQRDEEAAPREHFTPVQVRFPVNAPALRPAPGTEAAIMPVVEFDVENGVDGDKSNEQARQIKVEFEPNDIKFWFCQLEAEMLMASVKSQWLKKTILQRNLPNKQKEDVKSYLVLTKAEAGDTVYKDIKDELLRLYGPKPADAYCKALSRSMVGLPSQLGAQIIEDICRKPKKLEGCCCAGAAFALWSLQIPVNIRAHVSNMDFTSATYKDVFQTADKVYLSSKQVSVAAMSRAPAPSASASAAVGSLDETLPAFQAHNQEVAAIGQGKSQKNRNNRNNKNKGQNGQSSQESGQSKPKKHSSVPDKLADQMCNRHYRHGASAWFCVAPLTCPWASKVAPRT